MELSKIGSIRLTQHRDIPEGEIKGVQIVKTKTGKYFAVFLLSVPGSMVKTAGNSVVGIDMGIRTFCYDSDRNQFENPKYLARSLKKVKHLQQNVSRKLHVNKKKITQNYIKDKKELATLHEYIADQRDNRNHQVSRYYVNNYDIISVEDLDVLGMLRYDNYNKSKFISQST
ncbi:MAG TPA: transposase [Methanocella sp.]|nr:transposase [Methanocella sp.]